MFIRPTMELFQTMAISVLILISSSLMGEGYAQTHVLRDYCAREEFNPECDGGVIQIEYAYFGRMKLGTCFTVDYGMTGCKSDVTDILNEECFAKSSCRLSVGDDRLMDTVPCGELQSYLEVSHICLPVISGPREVCGTGDLLQITSPESGYISSVHTKQTGCGSQGSPWLIESTEGKSILVTLLDSTHTDGDSSRTSICLVYALIKETSRGRSETVCGGQSRKRFVYRSVSNVIEITIVSRERQFLLKYEFVGCADMPTQPGLSYRRDGNSTLAECENNGETSEFRCNGTTWHGKLPNCTSQEIVPHEENNLQNRELNPISAKDDVGQSPEEASEPRQGIAYNFQSITWGMVLIVIGIITAGIVACVFIISVVYLKRKSIECEGPILVPRPVSEAGYEVCDFDISQCTSSVYRDGYLTVPKDYTPMMNGTLPKYKKPDVWERPLPAEPNHV